MQATVELAANPFAILSFIVAPAILTNASSVLAMSTSNRLARAVDRARDLSRQLEAADEAGSPFTGRRLRELSAAETRALMLIRALRSFYAAMGGFAAAALISLLGAAAVPLREPAATRGFELVAVVAGLVAVGALVHGSVLLVRETRIAVQVMHERIQELRARLSAGRKPE